MDLLAGINFSVGFFYLFTLWKSLQCWLSSEIVVNFCWTTVRWVDDIFDDNYQFLIKMFCLPCARVFCVDEALKSFYTSGCSQTDHKCRDDRRYEHPKIFWAKVVKPFSSVSALK